MRSVEVGGEHPVEDAFARDLADHVPQRDRRLRGVERSGGDKNKRGAPLTAVEAGWGVEKIKRCGADAVKLLAPFEPTEQDSAEHQLALLRQLYDECQRHDILLLLEPVAFPFDNEKKDSESFLKRKAETVIESARILSRWCDVYKAEFPGHINKDSEATLEANLKALDRLGTFGPALVILRIDQPALDIGVADQQGGTG